MNLIGTHVCSSGRAHPQSHDVLLLTRRRKVTVSIPHEGKGVDREVGESKVMDVCGEDRLSLQSEKSGIRVPHTRKEIPTGSIVVITRACGSTLRASLGACWERGSAVRERRLRIDLRMPARTNGA